MTTANRDPKQSRFNRFQLIGLSLLALIAAYIVGSRALDTASWWEYGYTLVLVIFCINRVIAAFKHASR